MREKRWTHSIILLLLSVVFVSVLAGCGQKSDSSSKSTLKVTIADIVTNPVFQVAVAEGIFEKNNVDATIATFATPAEGINSLFINQVQVAYGADFPIINAASKGDYTIIASTGTGLDDHSAQNWKLFVSDDIQSGADLKGKTLSTLRGTFIPYLWDLYLEDNGLTKDDVKIIGQGGVDESLIALRSGEIDAVWVFGSANAEKFSELEGVHILTDMSKTRMRTGGDLIINGSLLKDNPEGVQNLIRSIYEATQFIKENPEKVGDIMYKAVKQPKEMTIADLAYSNWTLQFSEAAFNSLNGQKEYMVREGIIEQDFNIKDKIDLSALKTVLPEQVTFEP